LASLLPLITVLGEATVRTPTASFTNRLVLAETVYGAVYGYVIEAESPMESSDLS
jgi:hypothetical protein